MEDRVKYITLLVTRNCNLRCSYCYVRDYSGGLMPLDTAKQIVEEAFARDTDRFDLIEFTFLGGEPFCAFPLVRELSEWIWSQTWPKAYRLTAATNGTLVQGEIKDWLAANSSRFFPTLSYDGSGNSQNRNRSQSDGMIDLDFFHRHWPDIPVKMTISEESAAHMARDIIDLREREILVNDTFAGGVPVWQKSSLDTLDKQLELLCDYELTHESKRVSDLLSIDLRPVLTGGPTGYLPCGAGSIRITYDYDGTMYPCHLLSPLALSPKEMELLKEGACYQKPQRCASCSLDPVCPLCDGNSFRLYHRFGKREDCGCQLFRHQVRYACKYQSKRILRKTTISSEDRTVLTAIHRIMRHWSNERQAWDMADISQKQDER